MKKEPVKINELSIEERIKTFNEVVLGYSEEEAIKEAQRCLQCKNPTCIQGCPVGINIKKFIYHITQKDYKSAYLTIREKNNFPSICGRVCPAEYQCRKACVFTKKGEPYASQNAILIHFLERFVGDYGRSENIMPPSEHNKKLEKYKAAVIGSGPAGLCCAGELARVGIKVTIFESLHKAGGVLSYGIPQFRLPSDVLQYEIENLKKLGVEIKTNYVIGPSKSIKDLFNEGYDIIFLGLGAGTPAFLNIPGENLCNVYSANEFLTRINLMNAYKFPECHTPINIGKNIVIIGGGNTAMDASRTAVRMQKIMNYEINTTVLYRRTENEMPARRLEIEHAKEEGVNFSFLTLPLEIIGDENGFVKKIKCIKCELGEPDSSGRRKPIPIEGTEYEIDCDLLIVAIGLKANQLLLKFTEGIKTDKKGNIIVNPETFETSIENIYAGGDIVGGEGTVIEAMGMAKKAAKSIIEKLLNKK